MSSFTFTEMRVFGGAVRRLREEKGQPFEEKPKHREYSVCYCTGRSEWTQYRENISYSLICKKKKTKLYDCVESILLS